ncbi:MAG: TRAP transporter small permease subunit [Pseudomonadota bacterium]
MLDLAGNILNWLAAGVVFPLMLLPLAGLFSKQKTTAVVFWAGLVVAFVAAGILFSMATPRLRLAPELQQVSIFAGLLLAATLCVFVAGGASKSARVLSRIFEAATRLTGRAVMWLLLAMALVQFAVVLLRYVFGINYIFMQESITYMHGFVFLLAAGYALLTDDQVRVDIFYRDAPPKRKALTDLLGTYLFLFPVCLLIVWSASPYAARSWRVLEGSADASGIQGVFILKSLIPAFAMLLAMAGFVIAHRAVETLKGRGG